MQPALTPHLDRTLARVARRLAVARALESGSRWAIALAPLGLAPGLMCWLLTSPPFANLQTELALAALAPSTLGFVGAFLSRWLEPRSRAEAAAVVESREPVGAPFTTALELDASSAWSPLVAAEAEHAAQSVDPARVVPLRLPRALPAAFVVSALAFVLPLPVLRLLGSRVAEAPTDAPARPTPEALDALARATTRLELATSSLAHGPARRRLEETAAHLHELQGRLESGKVDQREALAQLAQADDALRLEREAEDSRRTARRALERTPALEPLANAAQGRGVPDERATRRLANKLTQDEVTRDSARGALDDAAEALARDPSLAGSLGQPLHLAARALDAARPHEPAPPELAPALDAAARALASTPTPERDEGTRHELTGAASELARAQEALGAAPRREPSAPLAGNEPVASPAPQQIALASPPPSSDKAGAADDKVRAADDKVRAAADKVRAAADKVRAAADKVRAAADKVGAAADKVRAAADKVASPADKVASPADKVASPADKVGAVADKVGAAADKVASPADKVASPADKVASPADKVGAAADKVASPADKVGAAADKVASPADNIASPTPAQIALASPAPSPVKTDSSPTTTDSSSKKTDSSSKETDSSSKKTDSSSKETDSSSKETDSSSKETDSSSKKTDSSSKETDSSSKETDSSSKETDSSSKETDSSSKETDSSSKTTNSSPVKNDSSSTKPVPMSPSSHPPSGEEKDKPKGSDLPLDAVAELAKAIPPELLAQALKLGAKLKNLAPDLGSSEPPAIDPEKAEKLVESLPPETLKKLAKAMREVAKDLPPPPENGGKPPKLPPEMAERLAKKLPKDVLESLSNAARDARPPAGKAGGDDVASGASSQRSPQGRASQKSLEGQASQQSPEGRASVPARGGESPTGTALGAGAESGDTAGTADANKGRPTGSGSGESIGPPKAPGGFAARDTKEPPSTSTSTSTKTGTGTGTGTGTKGLEGATAPQGKTAVAGPGGATTESAPVKSTGRVDWATAPESLPASERDALKAALERQRVPDAYERAVRAYFDLKNEPR